MRCTMLMLLLSATAVVAQKPEILLLSDAAVGSQRLETRYALAQGKWSDAGDAVAMLSTEIHCYKSFGFCEVATAFPTFGRATVGLESFDILRWDDAEMIAVDSSPICVMNNLHFDFVGRKVSLNSTSKGTREKLCLAVTSDAEKTAFLTGEEDETKRIIAGPKEKKK